MNVNIELLERELSKIVGSEYVSSKSDVLTAYLLDETPDAVIPSPARSLVLVKPRSTEEVSSILKLANSHNVPVFVRGGGTGLVGAAVPTRDGIILSMERFNKILEIDRENLMATVEAGVTLGDFLRKVDEEGLYFPPHPGDEGAQIGGLVVCNAGGSRAVKYGVMRNYVRGMEVVLPTGEVLNLGGKLIKDNFGFDLMQLIIGSEGVLGIVTKVVLRLYPKFPASATLIIGFDRRSDAVRFVPEILRSGIIPMAVEYVERELVLRSAEHLGEEWPAKEGNTFIMIILQERSEDEVLSMAESIDEIAGKFGALGTLITDNRREQDRILNIRSNIYTALKPDTVDILDVAVPPAKMGEFMDKLDEIAKEYEIYLPAYGHVADGNVHPHIMKEEAGGPSPSQVEEVRRKIYDVAISLGGVITGEHGIGSTRISYLEKYMQPEALNLMRQIKRMLDPRNILNPDKVIPS